ncbi:MAG: S8 family serine peptidase [Eggerthellaceae bacterium]|nr:S8 family serine peptidase [Eggerthellaceae bacterium]
MQFKRKLLAFLVSTTLVVGMIPFTQALPQAQALEGGTPAISVFEADSSGGEAQESLPNNPDNADGFATEGDLSVEGEDIQDEEADLSTEENPSTEEEGELAPLSAAELSDIQLQVLAALEEYPDAEYVENEVIVAFKDSTSLNEAGKTFEELEGIDEQSLTPQSLVSEDIVVVELSEGTDVFDAILELAAQPNVAYAHPNYLLHLCEASEGEYGEEDISLLAATTLNDAFASRQWALKTTNLYNTWTLARTNKKVAVAVIDTGVRIEHEDLKNVIVPGSYYDATKTKQTGDADGHGTHVAGIIAAEANNGKGVAGVSYNARIVPIRVQDSKRDIMSTSLIAAYTYLLGKLPNGKTRAQEWNVKVVNMSLGAPVPIPALENEINKAYSAGILTVCAAGNGADPYTNYRPDVPVYPGSYNRCINVSALKQGSGTLKDVFDSSYSSYGSTVNLSAPGTNIYSTINYSNTSYDDKDGTSMASPYVAGVAALVFASNPSATPAQVRTALEKTAVPRTGTNWKNYYGAGQVNPYEAVKYIAKNTITNDKPISAGMKINCKVTSTLPMATTWKWSIVSGSGTISSSGVLLPTKGNSTVKIRATYTQDSSVYVEKNIVIPKSVPIITASATSFTYDGTAKTPTYSIMYEGKTLKASTDFTVAYQKNVNAGTAKAIITGKGAWKGTEERTFTIKKAPLSSTTITVANATFTGSAVKPAPSVKFTNGKKQVQTLKAGTDYTVTYSGNTQVSNSGAKATITGTGNFSGTVTKNFSVKGVNITYFTHVQNVGNQAAVANGAMSGTSGRGLRVEALRINMVNNTGLSGNIEYQTQIQNIGWQGWKSAKTDGKSDKFVTGSLSGTSGQALRLETLRIRLTGDLAKNYDVYYRVHVQNVGWMGWAKNGEEAAGSVGLGLRMEAMQIYLKPKSSAKPGDSFKGITSAPGAPCAIDATAAGRTGAVSYNATLHIQSQGDTKYSRVNGTKTLGTSGKALRLEALKLALVDKPVSGGLSYSVHVQSIGWQKAVGENGIAGTSGRGLRLEALRINLTGDLAKQYDVYYRTHIQSIGWTGWAKNGQSCGSAGYGYRMEAMQVVIVKKGSTAPGMNASYFYQKKR